MFLVHFVVGRRQQWRSCWGRRIITVPVPHPGIFDSPSGATRCTAHTGYSNADVASRPRTELRRGITAAQIAPDRYDAVDAPPQLSKCCSTVGARGGRLCELGSGRHAPAGDAWGNSLRFSGLQVGKLVLESYGKSNATPERDPVEPAIRSGAQRALELALQNTFTQVQIGEL